jgi:hypothetical protein
MMRGIGLLRRIRAQCSAGVFGSYRACSVAISTLGILIGATSPAGSQTAGPPLVPTARDEERLRLLQLAGAVPLTSWAVRSHSPRELDRLILASQPRDEAPPAPRRSTSALRWISPEIRTVYNTGFPWGYNDGPVWSGRGATLSLTGGFAYRNGPLTVVAQPLWFVAENRSFSLIPNGFSGDSTLLDAVVPGEIDLPQRFGDAPFAALDAGQSTIRLDRWGTALGLSTANEQWGPATTFPFLFGNNAAGFPHVFLGTSTPVKIGPIVLHGRAIWGTLQESRWSPLALADSNGRRFVSGIIMSLGVAAIPGLEVGGGRVYHIRWPRRGLIGRDFLRPFDPFLKTDVESSTGAFQGTEPDNQLASVFFRWALPKSRFEVYGEYGRDDHNVDTRDLIVQPDHDATYMLGFQRVFTSRSELLSWMRLEVITSRISHLERVRAQVTPYHHTIVRQGHTQRGQVLGAPGAAGGGGFTVSYGRRTPRWAWSLGGTRLAGCGGTGGTGACDAAAVEASVERTSGGWTYASGLAVVDRRREIASDARDLNMSLTFGVRRDR